MNRKYLTVVNLSILRMEFAEQEQMINWDSTTNVQLVCLL